MELGMFGMFWFRGEYNHKEGLDIVAIAGADNFGGLRF